jgi:hypothetical protein|tara:strand:- start:523 stop:906 length:384 start_codon:yes stop_codon:yes gene_type:complete
LWKKHTLIPLDGRSYVADDLVNECVLLYKEIKKSLRLNGFINLDGTEIEDEMVSIGIGADYHTALITQGTKSGQIISVNIEIDKEKIVIYGGDLDKFIVDEDLIEHKSFTFKQKMEASKYFEILLSR